MRGYLALAVLGAVLVATGAALWSLPAGLVVLGLEMLCGAYGGAYVKVQGGEK